MDQIEVVPFEDGTWNWRVRVDGSVAEEGDGGHTRADAVAAARAYNGDEELTLTRADGSAAGKERRRRPEALRVVLLRVDGSEYGELDPAPSTATGPPHEVTLTPAGEMGEAVSNGG